jgi:hypothetical protein
MVEFHARMEEKITRGRKAAIQKHNDKTHVRSINCHVGDYVLVAEHGKSGSSKLQVTWIGPRRVARVDSDHVLTVDNLLAKELFCRPDQ